MLNDENTNANNDEQSIYPESNYLCQKLRNSRRIAFYENTVQFTMITKLIFYKQCNIEKNQRVKRFKKHVE
jgi:hypothetical protein